MNRLLLLAPRIATNRLWARAGEVPSFHIAPARTQNARDLITGSVLGTYNSASPAMAVGPDGILFQPAANAPVLEYDPTTLQCLGARIWGVVTNRLLNSTTGVGVSISSGTTNGPNNQVMRKAVPAAGSQSFPSVGQGIETAFSLSSGQTIDVAIGGWFAAGPSGMAIEPRLVVDFYTSPTHSNKIYAELQINTSNWTVRSKNFGAGVTEVSAPVITQYNPTLFPGVYRVDWVVRYTQGATTRDRTSSYVQLRDSTGSGTFTADGIGHFQFFGLQSTLSSTPQPYVPTTTTAASSTADVWTITGADFSGIWNQSAATMYAEAGTPSAVPSGPFPRVVMADDVATRNNQVQLAYYSGGQVNYIRTAAGVQAEFYPSIFAQTYPKVALAVAADNIAGASNGTITGTDSAAVMPTVDRLLIGTDLGSNFLNGYIRELAIFRSRRPNANLQAMTS